MSQDRDFYEKHNFLREQLKKIKGVQFHYHDSPVSTLEAIFARGDRRTANLLETAVRKGCTFDSWSEQFKWDLWQEAIEETGTDVAFILHDNDLLQKFSPGISLTVALPRNILRENTKRPWMPLQHRIAGKGVQVVA